MIAGTVTGNVGKDATTREHDGKTVLSFTVASRRFEKGAELTDWVDVSFWGERARKIAQYVTKGSRVGVRGTLYVREYEHNGAKRAVLTMRADDVELLGGKPEAQPAASFTPLHPTARALPAAPPQDFGDYSGSTGGDDEIPF